MKKLFHCYVELPKKVRLVSKTLCMDHTFEPREHIYHNAEVQCSGIGMTDKVIAFEDLFNLSKTMLFDNIYACVDEECFAYYRDNKGEKISLIGWIDINQYEDGGHYGNDELYAIKSVDRIEKQKKK